MAVDKITELYEKKERLVAEFRSFCDEKPETEWDEDRKTEFEMRSAELDDLQEEIEQTELRAKIDTRLDSFREQDEERQSFRKSEYGQFKANRQRSHITDEMRAMAFSGLIMRNVGLEGELRTAHGEAMHAMGLGNAKRFDIKMALGHTFGLGGWAERKGRAPDYREVMRQYKEDFPEMEYRGPLDTGTAGAGAEWVPAETFRAELIKYMIAFGGLRGVCRVITTSSGEPMRMPTADDTGNSAATIPEKGSVAPAVDPVTADKTWGAFKKGSLVKWSFEMMQDSPLAIQSILAQMLGERIGRAFAPLYASGGGTTEPWGALTRATDSGATWSLSGTDASKADALIDTQTALDPAYEASGSVGWVFKKAVLGTIRKLKDAENRYIWQPGLRAGEPDMLLGDPYALDQSFPDESGTNRFILYGDLSQYIIRDVGSMRTRVLPELYAETDEIGMTCWLRSDGEAANEKALLYVAASV